MVLHANLIAILQMSVKASVNPGIDWPVSGKKNP